MPRLPPPSPPIFFYGYGPPRDLHSFPPRRSPALPSGHSRRPAATTTTLTGPAPHHYAYLEFNERKKHFNAWVASRKVKKETDQPAVPAEEKLRAEQEGHELDEDV